MRALIVTGLVLALCAGGCFDTSTTGKHRHQAQAGTQPRKKPSPNQPSSTSPPKPDERKAKRWHEIILLRRHIEHVRYAALQVAPHHANRLRDRYPEFQTTSTKRLNHILGHWQARLARW